MPPPDWSSPGSESSWARPAKPDWRRWLTTREAALAATEGSARALGLGDRIGRLAPGYKADINQLVHSEDGTAVASVMIGGRLVVDNRRVVTVDLDRLRDRVAAARERLAAANADNHRLYEALEPVVGSYARVWPAPPTTSTAMARGWSSSSQTH